MKKVIIGICLVAMLYLTCACYDGQLDVSFGNGGQVSTLINNFSVASGVVIQSDNKIVVGGWSGSTEFSDINLTLARYNVDGTLDVSYGTGGIVVTPLAGTENKSNAILLQTDDKVIVGGFTRLNGFDSFVLTRYTTGGALDTTFGDGGIVISNVGLSASIFSIALQSDGKIAALGQSSNEPSQLIVARYYNNGAIDNGSLGGSGFGSNGLVFLNLADIATAASISVQENGRIVIGGSLGSIGNRMFLAIRLTSTGLLDPSFGQGGVVTTSFASDAQATDLKIQSDGKTILIGSTGPLNSRNFVLVRYNINGNIDATFGPGGIVTTDLGGNDQIFEVVLQSDDKLIVGGTSDALGANEFVLTRYTSHGLVDLTFNPSSAMPGTVFTSFIGGSGQIFNLALQQNGRIVASGTILTNQANSEFALARYLNNSQLPFTQITVPINNVIFSSPLLAVSGTARNPSNIGIFADGILIGSTATSGSTNNWSVTTNVPLAAGAHVITAVAGYENGNVNLASSNSVTIEINDCRSALSLSIASKYCSGTLT